MTAIFTLKKSIAIKSLIDLFYVLLKKKKKLMLATLHLLLTVCLR